MEAHNTPSTSARICQPRGKSRVQTQCQVRVRSANVGIISHDISVVRIHPFTSPTSSHDFVWEQKSCRMAICNRWSAEENDSVFIGLSAPLKTHVGDGTILNVFRKVGLCLSRPRPRCQSFVGLGGCRTFAVEASVLHSSPSVRSLSPQRSTPPMNA